MRGGPALSAAEAEPYFDLLAASIPQVFWVAESGMCVLYASRACEDMWGRTRDSLYADPRSWLDTIHPDDRAWVSSVLEGQGPAVPGDLEFRIVRPDGMVRWICIRGTRVDHPPGGRAIYAGVAEDITDRRARERTMRQTQFSVDRAFDAIFWIDRDARFLNVNPAACESLGYSRDELLAMTVHDVDPEFPEAIWPEWWRRVQAEGAVRVESRHLRKDGEIFPVEVAANYVPTEDAEMICAFARSLVRTAGTVILWLAADGSILEWNQEAELLYGWRRDEVLGKNYYDTFLRPEDRKLVLRDKDKVLAGQRTRNFENKILTRSGEERDVLWNVTRLVDSDERVQGLIAVGSDITERKRQEEERRTLEAKMQQAQKLESLGVLAGGIAHDFNNLLVGILGHAELAIEELDPGSAARRDLEEIARAARHAAELTEQLLAYSGKGAVEVRPLDLTALITDMTSLLEVSKHGSVTLHHDRDPSLPAIEADPGQARQVVMNLVTNASEAIGDTAGTVTIRTGVVAAVSDQPTPTYLGMEPLEGTYVALEVSDTGCGLDADTVDKIFDPFFTTKFPGRGLGLAAVVGIVRAHLGALQVTSKPGDGTTFRVLFPASSRRAEPIATRAALPDEGWESATVLVADDQDQVRRAVKRILERRGFAVLTAEDGVLALDLFRARQDEIDLVLLDLTMPRMGGDTALREMRAIRSDLRAIISSGYSEHDVAGKLPVAHDTAFIQKPYAPAQLMEKVREVLDTR